MKNVVGIKEFKILLCSVMVKILDYYINDVYMYVVWGGVGGRKYFF